MKATAERLDNNKVALTIEVDAAKVDAALERAYRKIAQQVSIPGFRKGKAPRRIIEARLGKEALYDEALEELIPEAYREALEQEQLDAIEQPHLSDIEIEEGKPLRFRAEVAVAPEVQLGEYKGIRLEKLVEQVEEKDIDHMLWHLQEEQAELVAPERNTVEDGDFVVIDFEGYVDGQPFDGGSAKGYSLQIGSGRFVEGFEKQLIGAEVGVETEIKVTLPEDGVPESLAGKEAVFKVTVRDIKVKRVPDIDDEFARDVSDAENLAELRQKIRAEMEESAERRADAELRRRIVELVRDQSRVEVPDVLVEDELVDLVNDFGRILVMMGIDPQRYLERSGKSVEDLKKEFRPEAEARVKSQLVLKAIAKREGIVVTPDELEAKIDELVAGERDPKEARKRFGDPGRRAALRTSLLLDRTVDFLIQHAQIEVKEIPSQGHGHHHHDPDDHDHHGHEHHHDESHVASGDPGENGDE